jgi:hypothetical protein
MLPRFVSAAALCIAFGLIAGCGSNLPRTVPVSGKVTWEDGTPITGASVRFVNATAGERDGAGYTDKEGAYSLSTFTSGDGAQPGDYTVVVTKLADAPTVTPPAPGGDAAAMAKAMREYADKAKAGGKKITDAIPTVYTSEKTSTLKFKVEPSGSSAANLKLKR